WAAAARGRTRSCARSTSAWSTATPWPSAACATANPGAGTRSRAAGGSPPGCLTSGAASRPAALCAAAGGGRQSRPDAAQQPAVNFEELWAFLGRNPMLSLALAGITVAIVYTELMRAFRGFKGLRPAELTALVNREN